MMATLTPSDPHTGSTGLQAAIDESATIHILVERSESGGDLRQRGEVVGFETIAAIRRFGLTLDPPTASGVTGRNVAGERIGEAAIRCVFIERAALASPDREPAAEPFDRNLSQRFVLQRCAIRLGAEGFLGFGAGRTFPTLDDCGQPNLLVGAVGEILEGTGRLTNCVGNFTLIGSLAPDQSFSGHMMVRLLDPARTLRAGAVAPLAVSAPGEPRITYLTWIAQKGSTPDQENYYSYQSPGQPRGVNIPVQLKRVWTDFSIASRFNAAPLRTGEVIGREIGFGRESRPRAPGMGTAATPFQFEGVSRYSFWTATGKTVGTITANVLEGRSIQVKLPGAESEPGLRFGYFGPLVGGTGCFSGVRGMLYGTAGSVFGPPPATHVISNLYVARLFDAEGRWRSSEPSAGAASDS